MDKAALLGCGVTTGYGSPINVLPVKEGSTVGVFGLGAIGMVVNFCYFLRHWEHFRRF